MLTVLLLDDDPISATHTADDLAAEGLKVIKASPFSALGAIKTAERVDAAILDPGRNEAGANERIYIPSQYSFMLSMRH
jgi:CheY-like chemotaxis protein